MEQKFRAIAQLLLNRTHLIIQTEPHRIVEIEFYYHDTTHPDPFAHRHPHQLSRDRWYFHHQKNNYRGGTFKGVDLTFGGDRAYGGILLRSLETPNGDIINGSCTCVDYILARTGYESVAALDAKIPSHAWDATLPFYLQSAPLEPRNSFTTARVGLSLKRAEIYPEMPAYLLRPYRYLTAPRAIRKGKIYLVLALYQQGMTGEEIRQRTGCPQNVLQRYFTAFESTPETDMTPYFGKTFTPRDLCQLHAIAKKIEKISPISH